MYYLNSLITFYGDTNNPNYLLVDSKRCNLTYNAIYFPGMSRSGVYCSGQRFINKYQEEVPSFSVRATNINGH